MKAIYFILQIIIASSNPFWTKAKDKFIFFYLDVPCEYLIPNSQKGKRMSIYKIPKSSDLPIFTLVGILVLFILSYICS